MSITAITFEEFLAEINSTEYGTIPVDTESVADESEQLYPQLMVLGRTIENLDDFTRFDGVRQDLLREVRGGLCTVEQAVAYLENFELHLLGEAEKATAKQS